MKQPVANQPVVGFYAIHRPEKYRVCVSCRGYDLKNNGAMYATVKALL